MYEHFPTLAPARTRDAAYPYAASCIGAVRRRVPLAASRRAWRVLPADEVVWRPFAEAPVPSSATRAHVLLVRAAGLAPGGVSPYMEEEVDPEDILYADKVVRYENSDGEQVEVTIPIASPPHRRSYDVVPEHYAAGPRVRVRRWMLIIDSLKRHCAKLTQKLSGRDREEAQVETSLRQDGPGLDLGQGSGAGTYQRHSDADRGATPFVYADPTRHSFGGASSSRPFVPPPGYYFGGSGPQPWGADPWTCWQEMEMMRQAQIFEAQRRFMAMPQPY
ncbi:hypothetical protein SOVF_097770 [Spinacia oleracea]|nr:hypothetical protein SOVF_097770 [Spinacia oleracea]